jgi:biotin synthesis protein BioG
MKHRWLSQNNNKRLIVYFSGWSMDGSEVIHLDATNYDVLCFYDYREIEAIDLPKNYDQYLLISWSFGVFSAVYSLTQSPLANFSQKIAVNGTTIPVDSNFGIPPEVFQKTLESYHSQTRIKFLRRTCGSKQNLDQLLSQGELRDAEEQVEELSCLADYFKKSQFLADFYTKALVSQKDFVIPSKNQLSFWGERRARCVEIAGAHLPFFQWDSWQEIIDAE